jgi:hypothetical protein
MSWQHRETFGVWKGRGGDSHKDTITLSWFDALLRAKANAEAAAFGKSRHPC